MNKDYAVKLSKEIINIINDKIDSKFKNSEIPNNFDIIIIGAGLSGLFLANELLNSNKKF